MKSPKPQTHSETGETGDYFYAHIVGESLVEPGELTAWKWVFLLVFVWKMKIMNTLISWSSAAHDFEKYSEFCRGFFSRYAPRNIMAPATLFSFS